MTHDRPPSPDETAERFFELLEEHFHGEKPPAIPEPRMPVQKTGDE